MGFRDDQEAALARAEALDREVKRLEEENAKLRAEAESAAAGRSAAEAVLRKERELDRVAQERDAEAKRVVSELAAKARAKAPEKPRREPKRPEISDEERRRQHKLMMAFTPWWSTLVFTIALFTTMIGSYLVGAMVLMAINVPFPPLLIVFMMPLLGGLWWIWQWASRRHVTSTRVWLAALPFSIDIEKYCNRMATQFRERVEVFVDIEGAGVERPLLERAACGAMPGATASWSGDTLRIESPKLALGLGKHIDNAKPHRWFRRLVKRALLPIHASHRIGEVRVL